MPGPVSTRTPRYTPDVTVQQLRTAGWGIRAIAKAIGATEREVWRWAGGWSRPLAVYARALAALPSTPPTPLHTMTTGAGGGA